MIQKYQKLVRDLIPDIIAAKGEKPVVRRLGAGAYKEELRKKLKEEVNEFIEARTLEAMREELADVEEVIRALCEAEHIERMSVIRAATKKRKERGGFEKRLFLIDVKK